MATQKSFVGARGIMHLTSTPPTEHSRHAYTTGEDGRVGTALGNLSDDPWRIGVAIRYFYFSIVCVMAGGRFQKMVQFS